jgi:hypothetical protein
MFEKGWLNSFDNNQEFLESESFTKLFNLLYKKNLQLVMYIENDNEPSFVIRNTRSNESKTYYLNNTLEFYLLTLINEIE